MRWKSAVGSAENGLRKPHVPSDLAAVRCACYVRFSNQLELSMPSVSSWAAGKCALPCARALLCGLVRARASRPRLPAARNLLGGQVLRAGLRPNPGLSPPPAALGGSATFPLRFEPPRPAGNAWGGLPLTPTARSPSSLHGCSRGFPGPLHWRAGLKAQAVGRRAGPHASPGP